MLNDVVILIPCHSLEDFPTDLGEKPAEGILNAFAVAWHPWVLAQTRSLPGWHRADSPPEPIAGRLIVVPTACDDRLESDWIGRQRDAGSFVISGIHKRDELLTELLTAARGWIPPRSRPTVARLRWSERFQTAPGRHPSSARRSSLIRNLSLTSSRWGRRTCWSSCCLGRCTTSARSTRCACGEKRSKPPKPWSPAERKMSSSGWRTVSSAARGS